jgi:SRSO17 transposase
MTLLHDEISEQEIGKRFQAYLTTLVPVLTHPAQHDALRAYCHGLLLDGRKTIEPIAARLAPHRVKNAKQSLGHFLNHARWSYEALISLATSYALPAITAREPISAWIIDDTGIPKKGKNSVGVAHQYCGQLGKSMNCQVAVTLAVANSNASMPVAYTLYLPESWCEDEQRRTETGVPQDIQFTKKAFIALSQIDRAIAEKLPVGTVLADAAYGNDTAFRDALSARDLAYAMAVQSNTTVWWGDHQPLPPQSYQGMGRPPKNLRRDSEHQPMTLKRLAYELPASAYEEISWRQGTAGSLTSRFARVRVRPAHREKHIQRAEEWLIIEWPEKEAEPIKYVFSTLPDDIDFSNLVEKIQLRWRIERDFQELKSELGLNEYEGRSWLGFHRHAGLCIATYAFLLAERGRFFP